MKVIKTLIVDDEAPARRRVARLLENNPKFQIVGEAENGKRAISLIEEVQPSLLLLDIQLKDMTGFDVLRQLKDPFEGSIVFITAFDEFAVKAFEANAVDYLLKPFKSSRLEEAIERASQKIGQDDQPSLQTLLTYLRGAPKQFIYIQEGKVEHRINLEHLLYIKSESYYNHFVFEEGSRMIRTSLKQTASQLPNEFVKINRSIIINTQKINRLKRMKKQVEVELISGDQFSANLNIEKLF